MTFQLNDETLHRAIDTYGDQQQKQMLFEELAELQDAVCKHSRGRSEDSLVAEEIADVIVMCAQMAIVYGENTVQDMIDFKMHRLKIRLDNTAL